MGNTLWGLFRDYWYIGAGVGLGTLALLLAGAMKVSARDDDLMGRR